MLGNPLFIDLAALVEPGLLTTEEVQSAYVDTGDRVDYGAVKTGQNAAVDPGSIALSGGC